MQLLAFKVAGAMRTFTIKRLTGAKCRYGGAGYENNLESQTRSTPARYHIP